MYENLISDIKSLYPQKQKIPLHEPDIGQIEKDMMLEVIESEFVSSVGPHVDRFERQIQDFTGAEFSVAVVNGTAALQLALRVCGVEPNDLVITQAFTFVATANSIRYLGADPVFIDIDPETLGLSPQSLADFFESQTEMKDHQCVHKGSGRRVRACLPMHSFGVIGDIQEIVKICRDHKVAVIEDSTEALGSFKDNQSAGCFATIGTLSFNGNKVITTGGGGALLCQDSEIAQRIRHLSTQAKVAHPFLLKHDDLGYNFRLPALNAAFGCSQMTRLPQILKTKKRLHDRYKEILSQYADIDFWETQKLCESNHWLNAVLFRSSLERDEFLKQSHAQGVLCRPVWELMSDLDLYKDCIADSLTHSKERQARMVHLPSGVKGLEL